MSNPAAPASAALQLSRILAPVNFSDPCRRAAECAGALARHFHAEVTLLHAAVPMALAFAVPEALSYAPSPEAAGRQVAERAALLEELLQGPDAPATRRVLLEDDPEHAIVSYAAEHHCDLIVMPTHGYSALQRLLLGSVTVAVLRDACCPVWTGAHYDGPPLAEFRAVLCALDPARESASAVLAWAAGFAASYRARLTIAHAIPMSEMRSGPVYFDPEWRLATARDARDRIETLLRKQAIDAEVSIELGDVPGAISAKVKDAAADLLVIGRGPHAYSIIRDSPCPIVAV
jgi:nucleotide-binding universal stress UspA family protein